MTRAPLRIEIVRDAARFAELAEPWDALLERAGGSIFQSHAWLGAWLGSAARVSGSRLCIALAWDGEALAAAISLAITRRRGLRALEWAAKEYTDYCDALIDPGIDPEAVIRRLWAAVMAAGGFDLAYLTHMQPQAHMLVHAGGAEPILGRSHRQDLSLRVRRAWPSGEAWLGGQTKKVRQNHRRSWKHLGETGAARFREIGAGEPLEPVLDQLAAMKRDWLTRTGNVSTLLDDDAAPLRALVEVLRRSGRLRLFVVECDGKVVAGTINLVERGRMMSFFAAYDHAHERASPGMLIMADYIMQAFDEGLDEVDFLVGTEEYKTRFANAEVVLSSAVTGRTLLGKAAIRIDAWRAGRRARALAKASTGAAVIEPVASLQNG